jgi:hypothetical protein
MGTESQAIDVGRHCKCTSALWTLSKSRVQRYCVTVTVTRQDKAASSVQCGALYCGSGWDARSSLVSPSLAVDQVHACKQRVRSVRDIYVMNPQSEDLGGIDGIVPRIVHRVTVCCHLLHMLLHMLLHIYCAHLGLGAWDCLNPPKPN